MSERSSDSGNVKGGAGITAGRDISIGDVTGQIAIGEYINQFKIQEPSGEALVNLMDYLEQKRQETVNFEILSSYNPSVLPDYPSRLRKFITINRVEELNKALKYLQDHRILLFTGIGGIGKTTLARTLVEIRPANVPAPFWFDFRQNEDAKVGDILEKLAAYMNSQDIAKFRQEKREAEEKDINKLTDKLQDGNPVWLIFDNLETMLDDICFHDENMDLLFTCLRNNTHQAKIIITSRIFPKLKNGEYLIDVIEEEKQDVKGLRINFAVDYLARNGLADVEPDELKKLAIGVDGHPLALKLLVQLVKKFGASDILEDLSIYQEEKEDTILKAKKLFDKLAGDEKELLERISVYREPVSMKGLKIMFIEEISSNDVKKLIDKSLLETDHKGNYWLHPLVREFAYDDLENKIAVHMLAVKYYLSLQLPEKPSGKNDVRSLIEAQHHACMAEEYDQAFHFIFDNNLDEYLDHWGNYTVLVDLYSKLLPKESLGDKILLKDKGAHGLVIRKLGRAYHDLGQVKKAIKYYEHALKIYGEVGDRHEEENALENLGSAFIDLGYPRKAIEYYEQALKISKEIGNRHGEGADLRYLGDAYSDLGDPRKGIKYYEQALKIVKEIGDLEGEGNVLGNLGNAYNTLGNAREAIEYLDQALRISKEIGDRGREGDWLGNLGNAYNYLGEPRKAIEYSEQALEIAKEIGNRYGEGIALGNIGNGYYYLGDTRKGIEYYEQALKISKELGDKGREGIWLGNLGLAYRDLGDLRKAIEYHEQALEISRETGYKLEEERALGNLGGAYNDLGDKRKAIEYYEQALTLKKEIDGLK